jgi:hypothetical protein
MPSPISPEIAACPQIHSLPTPPQIQRKLRVFQLGWAFNRHPCHSISDSGEFVGGELPMRTLLRWGLVPGSSNVIGNRESRMATVIL